MLGRVIVLQDAEFCNRIQVVIAELNAAQFIIRRIDPVHVTGAGCASIAITGEEIVERKGTVGFLLDARL